MRRHVPITLYTRRRSLLGMIVRGIALWWWRTRSELAPFNTAAALFVAGWWLHRAGTGWWLLVFPLTMVTTAGLAALPGRWSWVRSSPLARRVERVYAAVTVALTGTWLSAAVIAGPGYQPLPWLLLASAVGCGVPWWTHHRRRARVRVSRRLEAWPGVAESAGLAGSRVASAGVDLWGWTARIALRRGQTVAQVAGAVPAIESGFGARPGSVRVEPDDRRADRAIVRLVESDPHAYPIPYPLPSGPPRTVLNPIPLGLYEDGEPLTVRFAYRHTLIGGVTDAGKSGVVNDALAGLTACGDVALWGIDLKGGMEAMPWMPCLDRLAVTGPQAVVMLADAVAELDHRAAELASRGEQTWRPTPADPALFLVVDEYAELPDGAGEFADSIARRGRAVMVHLLVATQRPTQKAMGGRDVRSQMDIRICLRVVDRRDVDLVLPPGSYAAGYDATKLDAPGKFYIRSRDHSVPRRARAFYLPSEQVRAIAAMHSHIRPALMPERQTADPPSPNGDTERADDTARPDDRDRLPVPHQRPAPAPTPEERLWHALTVAPDGGVSVPELVAVTGKSRSWVYTRLTEHGNAGRAMQPGYGQWLAADTHRDPAGPPAGRHSG